jgi:hypothetical protein
MRLPLSTVSTKHFHFDKAANVFSAEASELPKINLLSPIYDDACDEGFALISAVTGTLATFYLSHTESSPDGECLAWHFKPAGPFNGVLFGLRNTTLVIFND